MFLEEGAGTDIAFCCFPEPAYIEERSLLSSHTGRRQSIFPYACLKMPSKIGNALFVGKVGRQIDLSHGIIRFHDPVGQRKLQHQIGIIQIKSCQLPDLVQPPE